MYTTVGNQTWRLVLYEQDNIEELARKFVSYSHKNQLIKLSEQKQKMLSDSIAFLMRS